MPTGSSRKVAVTVGVTVDTVLDMMEGKGIAVQVADWFDSMGVDTDQLMEDYASSMENQTTESIFESAIGASVCLTATMGVVPQVIRESGWTMGGAIGWLYYEVDDPVAFVHQIDYQSMCGKYGDSIVGGV